MTIMWERREVPRLCEICSHKDIRNVLETERYMVFVCWHCGQSYLIYDNHAKQG